MTLLGIVAMSGFVLADDFNPQGYIFYLYYDKGKLVVDRDFSTPFDVVPLEYKTQEGSFKGETFSFKNELLANFKYNLVQGRNQVVVPYFFNTKKVVFYDSAEQELLTLDVGTHSFCNENNVCDSNVGEDQESCPTDCKVEPTMTPAVLAGGFGISRGILFGIIGVIAAIVIWIAWRIIKKRKSATGMMPPILPPTIQ